MLAKTRPTDENSGLIVPRDLSDTAPKSPQNQPCHSQLTLFREQDLRAPPPPPPRNSRTHRRVPRHLQHLWPQRLHISLLDSNNPNSIDKYLVSPSPSTSLGPYGMPGSAYYNQIDALNSPNTNPTETAVPSLRMTPLRDTTTNRRSPRDSSGGTLIAANGVPGLGVKVDEAPIIPEGLLGASPSMHISTGSVDEIFVELVQTEASFAAELEIIAMIMQEVLVPMEIVGQEWLDAVSNLHSTHVAFVRKLNSDGRMQITPSILNTILDWPETAEGPYHAFVFAFRLGLDALFFSKAVGDQHSHLARIKLEIAPEGGDQVTLDYLFKRPLVRLRYYSKLYKYWTHFPPHIINIQKTLFKNMKQNLSKGHESFKILVSRARGRISEEKIRLQEVSIKSPAEMEKEQSLLAMLSGVDCSRYRDLYNDVKAFSISEFLAMNPGDIIHQQDAQIFSLLGGIEFPTLTKFIILQNHLILLGLQPPPKYLLFPPISSVALDLIPAGERLEIILGGSVTIHVSRTEKLEAELYGLQTRELAVKSPSMEYLARPRVSLTGRIKRSPAVDEFESLGESGEVGLHRQWRIEMMQLATAESSRGPIATGIMGSGTPPTRDPPPIPSDTVEMSTPVVSAGHVREDSVSFVRGVLQSSPSPSTSPPHNEDQSPNITLAPPQIPSIKSDCSPTRRPKPFRQSPGDTLSPNTIPSPTSKDPTTQLDTLPPAPSITPPLLSMPLSPRSIPPSRSVPAQLNDLLHFPATPKKTSDPPMLSVLEFGDSPVGMRRSFLANRSTSPRRVSTTATQGQLTGREVESPIAKDRMPRFNESISQMTSLATTPAVAQPQRVTGAGRISPSPTVCSFPPRTMPSDDSERRNGTFSVNDLRRISSPRQDVLTHLGQHRNNGNTSRSLEDNIPPGLLGKFVSAPCIVYFWNRGGWHQPDVLLQQGGEKILVMLDPLLRSNVPRVSLKISGTEGTTFIQHEIAPTSSIRRNSPVQVSIGCDLLTTSKKEYLMFAMAESLDTDSLFNALNTARSFVAGISEEFQQHTSPFARTTSFASSLATHSSVGSSLSVYDPPCLPSSSSQYSHIPEDPHRSALEERILVREQKVKIFLRLEAGVWKNLGNGWVWVFTTGPEVRVLVEQPTKKNPRAVMVDGRIFESGACERVGRTGVAVNLPNREGKISVYMLQSKNDREAQVVYEAIRKGKSALSSKKA